MATWATINKSDEIIYLVSEALDKYLIGSASNETLVTVDATSWSNVSKNVSTFINITKN